MQKFEISLIFIMEISPDSIAVHSVDIFIGEEARMSFQEPPHPPLGDSFLGQTRGKIPDHCSRRWKPFTGQLLNVLGKLQVLFWGQVGPRAVCPCMTVCQTLMFAGQRSSVALIFWQVGGTRKMRRIPAIQFLQSHPKLGPWWWRNRGLK
jgi:hypothetical protein